MSEPFEPTASPPYRVRERIDAVTTFVSVRATKLNELLAQLDPLLRQRVPPKVRLEIHSRASGIVEADPGACEDVLLHVVEILAKRSGGVLAINAEDVDEMPQSETTLAKTGAYTVISMDDNNWVPMNDMDRMRVHAALRNLGEGAIVQSTAGKGTHVRLFLRRLSGPSVASRRRDIELAVKPSGTVLVVEDEGIVRAPLCRALRNEGYTVLEAANGEDALRVLQQHHAPVHLVITDVRMPAMRGDELVAMLRDWYPAIRVMFMSGYSSEYHDDHLGDVERVSFLATECSLSELTYRVRDILQDAQRPSD